MLSLCSEFLNHREKSALIDRADRVGCQLQGDPLIFFGQVEALFLQVGQKATLGLNI